MRVNYTDQETKILVTSVTKVYPTLIKHYVYKEAILQRVQGFTPAEVIPKRNDNNPIASDIYFEESIRRTKTVISDLVLSNQFEHFATFTFAKDRQNIIKSKQKMSDWLSSQRKIHGHFDYLIVPEFHKDGKSLHFHALLQGYKGNLHLTNKKIGGRPVYNITSYKKGFSTLVVIDNQEKVSSYVKKYITIK